MKIEPRAVHAGRHIDPATGAVTPPIHLSTTFERSPEGDYPLGYSYSREDNPNRHALEECLASLEGGNHAICFSSGLAVATALVQGLEPGDHIIAPDDVYWGLRKVIGEVFGRWGIETSYVDLTNIDDFRDAPGVGGNAIQSAVKGDGPDLDRRPGAPGRAQYPHGLRRHFRHAGAATAARLRHRYGGSLHHEIPGRPQRRRRRGADRATRELPVRTCPQIAALWRQRAFALRLLAHAARHRYPALAGARAIGERHAGGALPGPTPRGGNSALPGTAHASRPRRGGAADVDVRRHALFPGEGVARDCAWRGGPMPALHTRHQPGRGAQPHRAPRQRRGAGHAHPGEPAAPLHWAGARRRPDCRSGPGAVYDSELKNFAGGIACATSGKSVCKGGAGLQPANARLRAHLSRVLQFLLEYLAAGQRDAEGVDRHQRDHDERQERHAGVPGGEIEQRTQGQYLARGDVDNRRQQAEAQEGEGKNPEEQGDRKT